MVGALVQRCAVHKHRNLLAHAPERLLEEISAEYNNMIYAKQIDARRTSFIRKWAEILEEAGDRSFTFPRLPEGQWRHAPPMPSSDCTRSSNAASRRKPCCPQRKLLFWALRASGQITMRNVGGWQTLAEKPTAQRIDPPASRDHFIPLEKTLRHRRAGSATAPCGTLRSPAASLGDAGAGVAIVVGDRAMVRSNSLSLVEATSLSGRLRFRWDVRFDCDAAECDGPQGPLGVCAPGR